MTQSFVDWRVCYRKRGSIKYISHLDMNRLMQRAFARARLPLWYTQGFNPHLYLTFALPLSLGVESECEWMDLRLTKPMSAEEFIRRLNEQLPQGVHVLSAAAPVHDVNDIAWCDWDIRLETPHSEKAAAALEDMLNGPITVEKKTKRGQKSMDIRPMLEVARIQAQPDALCFSARCRAGSETTVNPALLISALCDRTGDDARDAEILRTGVFCEDGTAFC